MKTSMNKPEALEEPSGLLVQSLIAPLRFMARDERLAPRDEFDVAPIADFHAHDTPLIRLTNVLIGADHERELIGLREAETMRLRVAV